MQRHKLQIFQCHPSAKSSSTYSISPATTPPKLQKETLAVFFAFNLSKSFLLVPSQIPPKVRERPERCSEILDLINEGMWNSCKSRNVVPNPHSASPSPPNVALAGPPTHPQIWGQSQGDLDRDLWHFVHPTAEGDTNNVILCLQLSKRCSIFPLHLHQTHPSHTPCKTLISNN